MNTIISINRAEISLLEAFNKFGGDCEEVRVISQDERAEQITELDLTQVSFELTENEVKLAFKSGRVLTAMLGGVRLDAYTCLAIATLLQDKGFNEVLSSCWSHKLEELGMKAEDIAFEGTVCVNNRGEGDQDYVWSLHNPRPGIFSTEPMPLVYGHKETMRIIATAA